MPRLSTLHYFLANSMVKWLIEPLSLSGCLEGRHVTYQSTSPLYENCSELQIGHPFLVIIVTSIEPPSPHIYAANSKSVDHRNTSAFFSICNPWLRFSASVITVGSLADTYVLVILAKLFTGSFLASAYCLRSLHLTFVSPIRLRLRSRGRQAGS